MIRKRKLIELALPADAINYVCARAKSVRHGHLWQAIQRVAGATVAADLESDDKDVA